MARRGGYTRNVDGIEWAKLSEVMDSEGKLAARSMGQTYHTWLNDAVAHHVYRCEMIQLKEQYRQDCKAAADANQPSPLETDYQPRRPPPTITREGPGGAYTASRGPAARP